MTTHSQQTVGYLLIYLHCPEMRTKQRILNEIGDFLFLSSKNRAHDLDSVI